MCLSTLINTILLKMKITPKLPNNRFTSENSADTNYVFLWKVVGHAPFMVPEDGWAIVGYGKAPWPGSTEGFGVMFEKITPAVKYGRGHEEVEEGTRIWQHGRPEWVPGRPEYEARMEKSRQSKK